MKGIPKKYQTSVKDFYKDEDGWWIVLKHDSEWVLEEYYAERVIHEDTKAEAVAVLKECAVKR